MTKTLLEFIQKQADLNSDGELNYKDLLQLLVLIAQLVTRQAEMEKN